MTAKPPRRLHVKMLKNDDVRAELCEKITAALSNSSTPPDNNNVDVEWTDLWNVVYQAAEQTIGFMSRWHQDWFNENDKSIRLLLDRKRKVHQNLLADPGSVTKKATYRDLCHEVQIKLRQMQDRWWEAKAAELQGYADRHHMRQFYAGLKAVYGPTHDVTVPVKSRDGGLLTTDQEEIHQRWVQHFEELFNTESTITEEALDHIPQKANIDVLNTPLTIQKTEATVKSMKNDKALGPNGIPGETYKIGCRALIEHLHKLFCLIWREDKVPQDLKDATTIKIYKNKGEKSDCSNYRGISLLSIAGKTLSWILLDCLFLNMVDRRLPESQCSFRAN
nr:PREDICTED: uncharacterized protein LOC106704212 [Latimeria chalumnae]|eukprot:XP_014346189.1 PREDICTED: uncharacterized protein LOC106704212 [Latimeria chalumnae]